MIEDIIKALQQGQQLSPEYQSQLADMQGFEQFADPEVVSQFRQQQAGASGLGGPTGPASAPPSNGAGSSTPQTSGTTQSRPQPTSGQGLGLIGTVLSAMPGPVGGIGKMLLQQGARSRAQAQQTAERNQVYQLMVKSGVPNDQAMALARDPKEATKFIRELQKHRIEGPDVRTVKDQYGNDVSVRYDPTTGGMVPISVNGAQPPAQPAAPVAAPGAAPMAAPAGVNPQVYARKRAELEATKAVKGPEIERKRINTMKSQHQKAVNMLGAIDRANKLLDPKDGLAGIPGSSILPEASTGVASLVTKYLPGSEYHDLAAALDVLRSNLSFKELAEMRANSPTGGALGNVTVRELELLSSTMANFDQNQSPEALRENLRIISPILQKLRGAIETDLGGAPAPTETPGVPTGPDIAPAAPTQEAGAPSIISPATASEAPESKVINGKTYIKRNGKWYTQ